MPKHNGLLGTVRSEMLVTLACTQDTCESQNLPSPPGADEELMEVETKFMIVSLGRR